MKTLFLLLLTMTFLPAETTGWDHQTFQYNEDIALPYASYREGSKEDEIPLVLFLHGAGERGDDNQAQLEHGLAELLAWSRKAGQPCHVLAPQCPKGIWWAEYEEFRSPEDIRLKKEQPYLKALLALVEETAGNHRIDRSRIYLTGLSMGGYGSFGLLAVSPETWAAAMPICGGGDATLVEKFKKVPLHIIHGEDDQVVPVILSRHMATVLREAGASNVEYTEMIMTDHDSWTITYRNPKFWEWMFAQKKAEAPE